MMYLLLVSMWGSVSDKEIPVPWKQTAAITLPLDGLEKRRYGTVSENLKNLFQASDWLFSYG